MFDDMHQIVDINKLEQKVGGPALRKRCRGAPGDIPLKEGTPSIGRSCFHWPGDNSPLTQSQVGSENCIRDYIGRPGLFLSLLWLTMQPPTYPHCCAKPCLME